MNKIKNSYVTIVSITKILTANISLLSLINYYIDIILTIGCDSHVKGLEFESKLQKREWYDCFKNKYV